MVRNADPTKTAGKADWRRESLMRPESPLFPSPGTAMKENRRPQAVILSAAKDLFVAGAEEILRCAQDDKHLRAGVRTFIHRCEPKAHVDSGRGIGWVRRLHTEEYPCPLPTYGPR